MLDTGTYTYVHTNTVQCVLKQFFHHFSVHKLLTPHGANCMVIRKYNDIGPETWTIKQQQKRSHSKLTSKCDCVLTEDQGSLFPRHLCDTRIQVMFPVTLGFSRAPISPQFFEYFNTINLSSAVICNNAS